MVQISIDNDVHYGTIDATYDTIHLILHRGRDACFCAFAGFFSNNACCGGRPRMYSRMTAAI